VPPLDCLAPSQYANNTMATIYAWSLSSGWRVGEGGFLGGVFFFFSFVFVFFLGGVTIK
jgi:hypothetical protein